MVMMDDDDDDESNPLLHHYHCTATFINSTTHPLLHKRQHVLGLVRQIEHRPDAGQELKDQLDGLPGQRVEGWAALGGRLVGIIVVGVSPFQPLLLLQALPLPLFFVLLEEPLELPIGQVGRVDVAGGVGIVGLLLLLLAAAAASAAGTRSCDVAAVLDGQEGLARSLAEGVPRG